jgi:hypothetical protein
MEEAEERRMREEMEMEQARLEREAYEAYQADQLRWYYEQLEAGAQAPTEISEDRKKLFVMGRRDVGALEKMQKEKKRKEKVLLPLERDRFNHLPLRHINLPPDVYVCVLTV